MGNRGFLEWASTRVSGVRELEIAWTSQKVVSQTDMFIGLRELLCNMPNLQRLYVPHHFSLPPWILSKLPASLVDASLCIAFNEDCVGDAEDDLPAYSFPEEMPNLKTLTMQAGHNTASVCHRLP